MVLPALVRPGETHDIAWIGGSVHRVALDAARTDGRLTVIRSSFLSGSASPVHVHPDEDETLVVLGGELAVWASDQRWQAGPGDTVFLPRGMPHTYRTLSDAELITICTPSGMERFFERAGWDLADGTPPDDWQVDPDDLVDAARLGGQVILGPPLEVGQEMPDHLRTWDPAGA